MIFSIITVTYNSATTLPATIASVLSQQGVELEYIIIDGASTDGTLEVIEDAATRDDRIRWISEPDCGIYDAMNKGWEMADPYAVILYLGAGDRIISLPLPEELKKTDRVVYGNVWMDNRYIMPKPTPFRLRCNNCVHHQAMLVPKALHPTPPFDLRYVVGADFDFNQRLLKNGVSFVFSPEFVSYALPGGISSRKRYLENLTIIRRNFGIIWLVIAFVFLSLRRVWWTFPKAK